MKYFEIILKVAFLGESIYFLVTRSSNPICWYIYAAISLVLGIVLYFNKKQSYGYVLSKREIWTRKIEGIVLVVFAIVIYCTFC